MIIKLSNYINNPVFNNIKLNLTNIMCLLAAKLYKFKNYNMLCNSP